MFFVFNLTTMNEQHYLLSVPRKQALKTTYAIANNMATRVATDFEKLMDELENLIVETKKCYTLGDYTVLKN